MELNMANKMKVVCPKCRASLKFDPNQITTEVVKFKCPSCNTVLRIRKPVSAPEKSASFIRHERKAAAAESHEKAGPELSEQSQKSEPKKDYAKPRQENVSGSQVSKGGDIKTGVKQEQELSDIFADETVKVSNSRRDKRVKFNKKVLVNNQIMVEALDISENGLFLHTGRSFDDGSVVEVGIPTLPGSFDLVVKAEVRHNHRGIGMGLMFIEVDAERRAKLKKLVAELDQAAAKEMEGKKKILLVGGSDTARNINKSKLVLDGFYVLQATTADEVFTVLKDEPPDAMVVEWQETKFNCKGLLARINQNQEYNAIIKVVLSALTDSQVQRDILDSGAHKYLAKMDTNPAKLSNILKQLIAERDGSN
jgi:predicted Zn finger-like uncharacterized protein